MVVCAPNICGEATVEDVPEVAMKLHTSHLFTVAVFEGRDPPAQVIPGELVAKNTVPGVPEGGAQVITFHVIPPK